MAYLRGCPGLVAITWKSDHDMSLSQICQWQTGSSLSCMPRASVMSSCRDMVPFRNWQQTNKHESFFNLKNSLKFKEAFFSLDHSKYRRTNAANWFWFLRVYLIVFYNEFKITPSTKWPAQFLSPHYWEKNSRQTRCIDKRSESQNDLFLVIVAPCQLA